MGVILFQSLHDADEIVAVFVEDEDGVAVGLFDEFFEGFEFSGVEFEIIMAFVIYSTVGKLAELAGENSGVDGGDLLAL